MARVLPITPALPSVDALTATRRRYANELPHEDLRALVGELEAARARAWARLATAELEQPTAGNARELLDARAMAKRLDVPESWLREAARRGRIPCVHLGRYMRFDPRAVLHRLTGTDA